MMFGQMRQTSSLVVGSSVSTRSIWASSGTFSSEGNSHKKEWYSPAIIKKESWKIPKQREVLPDNEWRGVFHHFKPKGIGLHVVHALQKGIDFRPVAIKNWYMNHKANYIIGDQSYNKDRVAALGFELAAAHFIVHRGGKIRFRNSEEWVEQDEDGEYELPSHYIPDVHVEAIDATKVNLVYEGLESIKKLKHLKKLNVSGSSNFNDWCVDRLCREYSEILEHLDISHCTKVTENGIAALARLRALRSLNLTGFDHVPEIKLLCILLEDTLPNIDILGINYMDM